MLFPPTRRGRARELGRARVLSDSPVIQRVRDGACLARRTACVPLAGNGRRLQAAFESPPIHFGCKKKKDSNQISFCTRVPKLPPKRLYETMTSSNCMPNFDPRLAAKYGEIGGGGKKRGDSVAGTASYLRWKEEAYCRERAKQERRNNGTGRYRG